MTPSGVLSTEHFNALQTSTHYLTSHVTLQIVNIVCASLLALFLGSLLGVFTYNLIRIYQLKLEW